MAVETPIEVLLANDSPSRMTILEGRIAVLERQIASAPQKDPEAKLDFIFMAIINELIVSLPTKGDAWLQERSTQEAIKRGIRKSLNHFYSGPHKPDETKWLEQHVEHLDKQNRVLLDRLQKARDVLDEDPEEDQQELAAALGRERV